MSNHNDTCLITYSLITFRSSGEKAITNDCDGLYIEIIVVNLKQPVKGVKVVRSRSPDATKRSYMLNHRRCIAFLNV